MSKHLNNRLKHTGVAPEKGQFQKTILLATARILQKVLEIKGNCL